MESGKSSKNVDGEVEMFRIRNLPRYFDTGEYFSGFVTLKFYAKHWAKIYATVLEAKVGGLEGASGAWNLRNEARSESTSAGLARK